MNCYDKAILAVSEIAMRRLGFDEKEAKFQTKILKSFVHKAESNAGISKNYWKYSIDYKIFGTGQGLGQSSAIWIGTNDVITVSLFKN